MMHLFQSETAKLQLFDFSKPSSMGLGGFCGFSCGKKRHFYGFHSTKILAQCLYKAQYILFCEVW